MNRSGIAGDTYLHGTPSYLGAERVASLEAVQETLQR